MGEPLRWGIALLAIGDARNAAEVMVGQIRERKVVWDGQDAFYSVPNAHRRLLAQVRVVMHAGGPPDGAWREIPIVAVGDHIKLDPVLVRSIDAVAADEVWRLFNGGCVFEGSVPDARYPAWVSSVTAGAP